MENIDANNQPNYLARRADLSERLRIIRWQMYELSGEERQCLDELIATNGMIRQLGLDDSEIRARELEQLNQRIAGHEGIF